MKPPIPSKFGRRKSNAALAKPRPIKFPTKLFRLEDPRVLSLSKSVIAFSKTFPVRSLRVEELKRLCVEKGLGTPRAVDEVVRGLNRLKALKCVRKPPTAKERAEQRKVSVETFLKSFVNRGAKTKTLNTLWREYVDFMRLRKEKQSSALNEFGFAGDWVGGEKFKKIVKDLLFNASKHGSLKGNMLPERFLTDKASIHLIKDELEKRRAQFARK